MGRPPKDPKDKRQLISVRFDATTKAAFEKAAEESGRSLAGEVEYRAAMLADLDARTVGMLADYIHNIKGLERRNSGKRWHSNLRTWAAVSEMMTKGPIRDLKPVNDVDKEVQDEAWAPLSEIINQQEEVARKLGALGVPVRALETRNKGLLGSFSSRALERASIEAIPDDAIRHQAIDLHEQLVSLDQERTEADSRWAEVMEPYWQEEREGRALYRTFLREEAARKRAAGETFNWLDLLGIDR